MTDIEKLVRPNILSLQAYSSARDEYKGKRGIFLDANENPFGKLNRYPDPQQKKLKSALAKVRNIPAENIFIGNGSDEVIDLAFRIFCVPGKDKAIVLSPTYGMYAVLGAVNDVEIIDVPLDDSFQVDMDSINRVIDDQDIKLLFICSPNNPTGNTINNLEIIFENFKGIIFLDEAYIDFCSSSSWLSKLSHYPNLIISQTMSKAWGLAAARIGIAYASGEVISWFNKIKPPHNLFH